MVITNICVYRDDDNECFFEFPGEPDYFSDSLYDAMELMDEDQYEEAEQLLRLIIGTCPDHIDAIFPLLNSKRNWRTGLRNGLSPRSWTGSTALKPQRFRQAWQTIDGPPNRWPETNCS